ncbi:MAG TPA: glycosyl transferase family 1, partial [Rhodopila sp.]|nr:glycosyl transferase family 1 [Rhodopila sp.]
MQRLLLADRIKDRQTSFLSPLLPALERHFEVRFLHAGPGSELAAAIGWADIVWLEWCWDHAVWATRNNLLGGKPCILRLHSIEALQTQYPAQVDWHQISRLITVAPDIADVLGTAFPGIPRSAEVIFNGIDTARFREGRPDRYRIAWVGHLEPKKNPMLLMQIAHKLRQHDPRYSIHVAGAFTDLRTARYLQQVQSALDL